MRRPAQGGGTTLGGTTDNFDSVAADLHEESAPATLLVGPQKGGHFKNLERIAGPPADKPAKLVDLALPLGQLAVRELHCRELRSKTSDRIQLARTAARIFFSGQRCVHQEQIDIAFGVPIAARCGPENAPIYRLGIPGAERLP